mgnify:CR=1
MEERDLIKVEEFIIYNFFNLRFGICLALLNLHLVVSRQLFLYLIKLNIQQLLTDPLLYLPSQGHVGYQALSILDRHIRHRAGLLPPIEPTLNRLVIVSVSIVAYGWGAHQAQTHGANKSGRRILRLVEFLKLLYFFGQGSLKFFPSFFGFLGISRRRLWK